MANNPLQSKRTKHVDIRFHFVKEKIKNGEIVIDKVKSADMIADLLTKNASLSMINSLRDKIFGVFDISPSKNRTKNQNQKIDEQI